MVGAPFGLQSLAAMAQELTRVQELNELLETAAEQARTALAAATVSISSIDAGMDAVRTIINVGDLADHEVRWPTDETYPVRGDERLMSALRDRRSWVDSLDDPASTPLDRTLLQHLGKGCSLSSAIVVDGEPWGEFYSTRHVGDPVFDDDAVAYAEVLVAILSAAISRAIREAALAVMAFHDPLTGLFNRRGLDDQVTQLLERGEGAAAMAVPVAVVVLDIDGLKRVNDTLGHARGDQVIRGTATALTEAFDAVESSVVARVGGDEFTVLVSGDDVDVVEATINQVCEEVGARSGNVGLSAGIASAIVTNASSQTLTELFSAADRAQYVAKRTGSRVAVVADDVGDPPVTG